MKILKLSLCVKGDIASVLRLTIVNKILVFKQMYVLSSPKPLAKSYFAFLPNF